MQPYDPSNLWFAHLEIKVNFTLSSFSSKQDFALLRTSTYECLLDLFNMGLQELIIVDYYLVGSKCV